MEYTTLGRTDLKVSRVGFGCWAMGGHGWGKVDDRESVRAVRRALDLGVNFFDTADVYGFGHSEEVLAQALGEQRKEVVIATKFGTRWDDAGNISRDASPRRVGEALEASLRRLQLDCIPLYQMHWPDPKTPLEATLETLKRCCEIGKIRYIGCCNFSLDLIRQAQNRWRVESLQVPYSIVDRGLEEEILVASRQFEMGVVAYNPLAQGLLSGKFSAGVQFASDDIRSRSKYFKGETFGRNLRVVSRLRVVATRYGRTPAQVALRWILDNPAITCAIPGAKSPNQAEDNAGAMGWRLARPDYDFLSSGAGS